jgi:hypothetical protein
MPCPTFFVSRNRIEIIFAGEVPLDDEHHCKLPLDIQHVKDGAEGKRSNGGMLRAQASWGVLPAR